MIRKDTLFIFIENCHPGLSLDSQLQRYLKNGVAQMLH